jgi:hypothetical protein
MKNIVSCFWGYDLLRVCKYDTLLTRRLTYQPKKINGGILYEEKTLCGYAAGFVHAGKPDAYDSFGSR